MLTLRLLLFLRLSLFINTIIRHTYYQYNRFIDFQFLHVFMQLQYYYYLLVYYYYHYLKTQFYVILYLWASQVKTAYLLIDSKNLYVYLLFILLMIAYLN